MNFVETAITSHDASGYVCGTAAIGHKPFPFISAYLVTGPAFLISRLDYIAPHIICGDFNARNVLWGSTHTNARGKKLADLLNRHGVEPLNDGSITYLKSPKVTSCSDLSFVSAEFARRVTWITDIETKRSDHCPSLVTVIDA